jgi:hypothetical protein
VSDRVWLLGLLVTTCVMPTLVFVGVRGRHPAERPIAALVTAWLAMWVGQLAAMQACCCWVCINAVFEWLVSAPLAALVYGVVMAVVTGWIAVMAMRLFRLGIQLLAVVPRNVDESVATAAGSLWRRAALAVLVVVFYTTVVLFYVRIPGRWGDLVYFALVLVPSGLTAGLVTLVAFVIRVRPWRATA